MLCSPVYADPSQPRPSLSMSVSSPVISRQPIYFNWHATHLRQGGSLWIEDRSASPEGFWQFLVKLPNKESGHGEWKPSNTESERPGTYILRLVELAGPSFTFVASSVGHDIVVTPRNNPKTQVPPSIDLHFSYKTPDGWTYSGIIPVPKAQLVASVDIASSPPGFAQFKIRQSVSASPPLNFADTNPGRPNGPPLSMNDWIVWGNGSPKPVPAFITLVNDLQNAADLAQFDAPAGPCDLVPHDISNFPNSLYGYYNIYCNVASGSGDEQWDVSQSVVTAAVHSIAHWQPYFVVQFASWYSVPPSALEYCDVFVTPTGRVIKSGWSTGHLGTSPTGQKCGTLLHLFTSA
jgi:hypothetical protein